MKKIIMLITTILFVSLVSACEKDEKPEEIKPEEVTEVKEEKKSHQGETILYDSELCEIKFKGLSSTGITFSITNKMDYAITIMPTAIALDGQTLYDTQLNLGDIEVNETKEFKVEYQLKETEHKTISGGFRIDWRDDEGEVDHFSALFDSVDIGGEEHQEYEISGTELFNNDRLTVWYDYSDLHSMYFFVENKRDIILDLSVGKVSINGSEPEMGVSFCSVAPNSTAQYVCSLIFDSSSLDEVENFMMYMYTGVQGSTVIPEGKTEEEIKLQYPLD